METFDTTIMRHDRIDNLLSAYGLTLQEVLRLKMASEFIGTAINAWESGFMAGEMIRTELLTALKYARKILEQSGISVTDNFSIINEAITNAEGLKNPIDNKP